MDRRQFSKLLVSAIAAPAILPCVGEAAMPARMGVYANGMGHSMLPVIGRFGPNQYSPSMEHINIMHQTALSHLPSQYRGNMPQYNASQVMSRLGRTDRPFSVFGAAANPGGSMKRINYLSTTSRKPFDISNDDHEMLQSDPQAFFDKWGQTMWDHTRRYPGPTSHIPGTAAAQSWSYTPPTYAPPELSTAGYYPTTTVAVANEPAAASQGSNSGGNSSLDQIGNIVDTVGSIASLAALF